MFIEKLLIGTTNKGKVTEIRGLLKDCVNKIVSLDDLPPTEDIEETGKTFEENAILKAETLLERTEIATLADDSGLEVDALDGAPGIYSARFAGENATDSDNNNKLIKLLRDVDPEKRTARFQCVLALACPGETKIFSGEVTGRIELTATGAGGFGYDPHFIPEGYDRSFGELGLQVKREISHRSRALQKLISFLREQ